MRPSRILNFVLGTFLVAAMALTAQAEAQTDENPQAVAYFEAGVAAYEVNNLPLAYQEFLAAAREGHADAQFNVAMMYEQGIGVGKDEQEAVAWYGESAEQGNSAAQFNLGVLYENGRGTPKCHNRRKPRLRPFCTTHRCV